MSEQYPDSGMRPSSGSRAVHPAARPIGFEDLLRRFEVCLDQLRRWGISVHPTSRLKEYATALRTALDADTADHRFLERLSFFILDASEVVELVEHLSDPSDRVLKRLQLIATGGSHPDDEAASPGRDAQFELWLVSFLASRGVPARVDEPDLSITWNGATIPVEAKRPKSQAAVDVRFRKALKQLDAFPTGGIVAVSLDLLLRPRGRVLYAESPLDASQKMDLLFVEESRTLLNPKAATRRAEGRNAIGLLLTAKLPAFVADSGMFVYEFRSELLWFRGDARRRVLDGLRDNVSSRPGSHSKAAS